MIQHEVTRDLEAERQQIVADLRDKAEAVESAYAAADLSLAELGDVKDEYEGSLRDARQWCAEAGARRVRGGHHENGPLREAVGAR